MADEVNIFEDEDEVVLGLQRPDETQGFVLEDDDEEPEKEQKGSGEDALTQEEKLHYFADKLLSSVIGGKSVSKYAMSRLISSTSPKLFRDENHIIFSILYHYRERVSRLKIDKEFVNLYLENNMKILDESQGYIDITSHGKVDGSDELGYIAGVMKHFERLQKMPSISEEEFELLFEKYVIVFKQIEAQKIYIESNVILTEGMRMGRKMLRGFEDSVSYVKRRMADVEGLVNMNKGTGFTSMRDIIVNSGNKEMKSVKIADFDKLEELNAIYGGIYTGMFYEVLAPSKGGKSKFCARVCHTAIVKYGTNVTVWAHEGGNESWTAQMRAIHFDYTYNTGASVTERKLGVDQDTIEHEKWEGLEDYRDLELSSSIDLSTNLDYGNVDCIDRPFDVETFLEEIDTSVKANNSKLVIIDYLQLMSSANSRISERERISKAYQTLLAYCKKNNVAVLTPAQYTQASIDALANKSENAEMDMRTSGGGSAEVFRTPDIIFALWASTADLRNNSMTILSVPCRFNKAFPEIPIYVDLGSCNFVSINRD